MELKARLTYNEMDTLDDARLLWVCAEPFISKIRGKSPDVKQQVFQELASGQQALYLFQIMNGHTRSVSELYWFSCEYLGQPALWAKMKQTFRELGCHALVSIYERIEAELGPRQAAAQAAGVPVTVLDLERDTGLFRQVAELLAVYRTAAGEAVRIIAAGIRSHVHDYASLEEADSASMV